jgi:hypothetical protein
MVNYEMASRSTAEIVAANGTVELGDGVFVTIIPTTTTAPAITDGDTAAGATNVVDPTFLTKGDGCIGYVGYGKFIKISTASVVLKTAVRHAPTA